MLAGTGFALVAILYLLYAWSASTSFVTLYSQLDPSDSGQIVDQLRARGIEFELEQGGSTLRVPESVIDELRVDFAAQGLPEGGHVGFEIFEGNAFTATDFVQRLNFQRGLQGELARTIETFPAVDGARAHIVLPERTLFREDDEPATASVVLQMRPGRGLDSGEVSGIAHLVAGAVAGLEKQNVTILNSTGAILFDGATANQGGMGFTTNQQQLQGEYEQTLTHDVQQMLDRALGLGKAVVTVSASLDFDQVEQETSTFDSGPTDGVPLSTSVVTEKYTTNDGSTASAVPGAVANLLGANADLSGATPGTAERLSVSLLLDDVIPEDQALAIEKSVAAAIGLDAGRGDTSVVTRLTFDQTALVAAEAIFDSQGSTDTMVSDVRLRLPVVALLIAFFFFRMLMGSISRRSYRVTDHDPNALPSGEAMMALQGAALRSLPEPDPEEMKSDLERQVAKLAENHPDTVTEQPQSPCPGGLVTSQMRQRGR